jgi:hypothetical protein
MKQEKKSIWVSGMEHDISNYYIRKKIWLLIAILSCLSLPYFDKISDPAMLLIILLLFVSLAKHLSYLSHPDYLAYYIYQIGYELIDFENDYHYLKRNQKYLKNCMVQIRRICAENTGYFSGNISDFFNNLHQIVLHLNYLFDKGEVDETFRKERTDISLKLIELADLIHKNHSNLTPKHLELTTEILNLIKHAPVKSFGYHKLFMENIKQKWAEQPYVSRIFLFLLSVFILFYLAIFYFMINYGLERESCVTSAITGSIALVVASLLKIEVFIKR